MPKSKHRKRLAGKSQAKTTLCFPVYYEQSEEDTQKVTELVELIVEDRKAAGIFPEVVDESDFSKMKVGREFRQLSQIAEERFYQPVKVWLKNHPQFATRDIVSIEYGFQVTIEFTSKIGQDAFLKAFPGWTKERLTSWMDGIPTAQSLYDLPDDYTGDDGQHRRDTLRKG